VDGTFELIAGSLEKAGIRFLLAGGFAVNMHGYARGTEDLDLIVAENNQTRADDALGRAGFRLFRKADVVCRYEPPPGMRFVVDVLPVNDQTFASLWEESLVKPFQGHQVHLPSLNHLLAMKIHAMKHDKMIRGLKDLLDIAELARVNGLAADSERLRDLCLRFGNQDIWSSVKRALSEP
jgi:hypothetical protein